MISHDGEFPHLSQDNQRIWDGNATWWDDRIGDGNAFQTLLIEPATERLLQPQPGDTILDIACGAGRFARRMAELGARVLAFDQSEQFIARARERTPPAAAIDYRVATVGSMAAACADVGAAGKAVCTMAIMDMPEIKPVFGALRSVLARGGAFVFSLTHPCFIRRRYVDSPKSATTSMAAMSHARASRSRRTCLLPPERRRASSASRSRNGSSIGL